MANKVKRLQKEADEQDAAVEKMKAEAVAKRNEARKAEHDYIRRQSGEALANLQNTAPKPPGNPYMLFRAEKAPEMRGLPVTETNKKLADMWKALSDEKKKEYQDRSEAERKKYNEWSKSDEGQKVLAMRS